MDKFYGRFVYFEDTVTDSDKIVMSSHRGEANRYIEIYPVRSQCSLYTAKLKTLYFVIICSVADLLTLNSNKFRMVY